MRIGITVGLGARAERTIAGLIERAQRGGAARVRQPLDAGGVLVRPDHRARRRGPGDVAARDRDGRGPDVPAPSGRDGAAGADRPGRLDGRFTLASGCRTR